MHSARQNTGLKVPETYRKILTFAYKILYDILCAILIGELSGKPVEKSASADLFCVIGNSGEFPITQKGTNVPKMRTRAKM